MFNKSRSRMFVVLLFAILSISAISIYYVAPQATAMFNGTSIDTHQISGAAIVSRDDDVNEIIPPQSQVEAAQLSRTFAMQSRLSDLAPTLVDPSPNVFLLPDLAPTLIKSPRDTYDLPDLAPTFANPLLGVYRYSDLALTLVQATEGSDRLPDLAPTLVQSTERSDCLPDLAPTLVQATEGSDRLPDLAPTLAKSPEIGC
ncbi:MAG: hypothetical protein U9R58_11260 [Chloroflexota bacterium]|nr:hypothetical protein [Chloroflexota bacterium]